MENTLRSVRSLMACNFFLNIFFFLTTITSSNHYMPNVISCDLWTVIMYRCMNYLKFVFKDHEKGAEQNYTILKTHYWRPLLKLISQVQQKSEGTSKNAFKNTKRHSSNMWIWLWSWLSNESMQLTWCSRFYIGSCHSWCSRMCRSLRAGPGSRNISDSGCANSCPWHTGENGRRSFPHIPRSASTTEILLQQVVAGHFLQGSPLCLQKHKETAGIRG